MNLTSPSQVKAWCIDHDFHPNRTLGQNFLIDRNVLEGIVDIGLEVAEGGEAVLEVGPGLGVLTEEMLRRGHPVVAIEKDHALAERLCSEPPGDGLTIVEGDALDERVVARALEAMGGARTEGIMVVSNLPYQAGTRIILDFAEKRLARSMTVLLQTEVAERLAAGPGGRSRSLAGVLAQLDYDVEIIKAVPPSCFWPRPEVGSSVARLVRHYRNASLSDHERDVLRRLAKAAFSQRRKMLSTVFRHVDGSVFKLTRTIIPPALASLRAEALSVEDWVDFVKGTVEG